VLAICLHPGRGIVALVWLGMVTALTAWLANNQIGGQTGDVCGAAAALGEIATLLALLIGGRDA
ncbi:MAG: adenosylcobinamide-GDP ribazoletransferase, partial [Pseudomonadota bacterium]|nr:adenosylcobinamide-GDP ribazoletransferase [Pseudomonadota bacterium]